MDHEVDRAREAIVDLPAGFYLSIKDSDLVELYMLPRVVGPFNPEVFEVAPIMHILPHELPQDPRNLGVGNIGDRLREIFQRSDSLLFIMQGNPLKGPAWRMCVKGNTICERSIVYRGPQHLGFRSMFFLMENGRSTGWLMDIFEVSDRNNVAIMDWRIVKFRQKVIDIEVIEGIHFGLPLLNEVARVLNLLHNFENGWGASRDGERELIVDYLFARVLVLNHPNYPPIFEDSPILRVPIEDLSMDPRNLPQEMRTIYNTVGSIFFLFSQEPTLVPVGGPFEWHQCTPRYDGITGAQNEIVSSHRTTFFHLLRENGGISSGWLMHIYRPTQLGVEIHLGNQGAQLDLNWRLVRIYRKLFEILPDVIAPNGNPPVDNPPGDNPPGDNPPGDNPPGDNPPGDNPPGDNPPGDNPPGDNPPIANPEFPLEQLDESADVNLEENEEVTITPEVTSSKVCRDIISELVKVYRESHLGKCWQAYDGKKSLYAAGSLPFSSKDFVVKLVDKDRKDRRVHKFDVAIKFALQQFLGGRQLDVPQETLDVALPSAISTNFVFVRMSFLLPSLGDTATLGNGLQYWKGFYQSLQPTQMGLSLSVDMSARAFYEPVLISKFVEVYCNIRDLKMTLSDQDRIGVQKALTNIRVQFVYRDGRQYKISGVLAQPLSQLMFSRNDLGTKSLVVEFYPERYQINLSFPSLPAFQAGSYAKPVYLPMELCKIVDGQMCSKKLNETSLLRATCQRPADREQSIKKMVGYNNYNDNLVNDFGLRVKAELATIDARVFPLPMKMVNGGKVAFWTCVSFSQMRQNEVYRFCEELVNVCRNKGMDFDPPHLIPIDSAHPGRIEKALVDIHAQSNEKLSKMGHTMKQLQFIIILPEVSGSCGTIKRVCETELGMISQCNQPRHAMKCQKQYLENHSLKFNVKACVSLENCHGRVWGPKSASSGKSAAGIAMHMAGERTPVNAKMVKSRYTTGAASQSFTSTSYDRVTINDFEYVTAEKNPKKTTHGDLNIELHCDIAPRVCENFITLCERGYYNGVAFRRNIRNFMIRRGDPTGTGKGGESVWGKPFKDEVDSRLLHSGRGVVSMAYSGPHTNGSQFFILYKSANHLNFKCTVLGGVVGGLLTLSAMEKVPVDDDDDDRPLVLFGQGYPCPRLNCVQGLCMYISSLNDDLVPAMIFLLTGMLNLKTLRIKSSALLANNNPDEEDKKEKAKDEKNAEDEDKEKVGSWYSNPGTGAMESGAGSGGVGKYLKARSAQPESAAAATRPQAPAVAKKRKMGAPVGGFKDFPTC